jgi:hypothetical protein
MLLDDEHTDSPLPKVQLDLWRADAVVLFDWLMTVDLNEVPIRHPAEKQALADLLTQLEVSDVTGVDQEESTRLGKRSPATWAGELKYVPPGVLRLSADPGVRSAAADSLADSAHEDRRPAALPRLRGVANG